MSDDNKVRDLNSASTVQAKREQMIRMLSDTLCKVASGEALGVILTVFNGGRQYQIMWAGEYDPMQLAGAIEATKLQILPSMLGCVPTKDR